MSSFVLYLAGIFFLISECLWGIEPGRPIAKFSFNSGKDYDEISLKKIKCVGVSKTRDRFNNEDCALYFLGSQSSYISLGNYPAIKPVNGSISLWAKVEFQIYAGQGHLINPLILTKSHSGDDFYEAYAIYYIVESNKIGAANTEDSLKQISIISSVEFTRNEWHHLVMTYDHDSLSFYIDGKREGKIYKGFDIKFLETDSVILGCSANRKNSRYYNGSLDDIEFYDRVLNDAEVLELYNAPDPNRHKIVVYGVLIFSALLALIAIIYAIARYKFRIALKKERERLEWHNKILETELRVNRALMNPHFIFNSLNAFQRFILKNQVEGAMDYLAKFSKLIRKTIEGNMSDTISLNLEIELIEGYLEIENMRINEKINYTINLAPDINAMSIKIPVMLLQPFIENSIWHGFHEKEGPKHIWIHFFLQQRKYLECIIEDNGTGRKPKVENEKTKKSLATMFIIQRLDMLNKIHNLDCSLSITDKPNNEGTIVKIVLPILNQKETCHYVQL